MTHEEKSKAVFEGTAQAFSDWLWEKSITTPECIESGVKQAVYDWLNEHELSIMDMLREVAKDHFREATP